LMLVMMMMLLMVLVLCCLQLLLVDLNRAFDLLGDVHWDIVDLLDIVTDCEFCCCCYRTDEHGRRRRLALLIEFVDL
jgi:hypothetical protein